jgi:hypothetical protein
MYIDKDFDSLVKYYSMRFKKNQDWIIFLLTRFRLWTIVFI